MFSVSVRFFLPLYLVRAYVFRQVYQEVLLGGDIWMRYSDRSHHALLRNALVTVFMVSFLWLIMIAVVPLRFFAHDQSAP